MIITIIGSRKTPQDSLDWLMYAANYCTTHGHTVRSGKADGADTAAILGCIEAYDLAGVPYNLHQEGLGVPEMFVPWNGFGNKNLSSAWDSVQGDNPDAHDIAGSIHPAWHNCKESVRKLHTRNVCQILGEDLHTPSDIILYWCEEKKGKPTGGTATAVNLALSRGIQCINMLHSNWMNEFSNALEK